MAILLSLVSIFFVRVVLGREGQMKFCKVEDVFDPGGDTEVFEY